LNREADPSQFAQPIFAEVVVPISTYDMEGTEGNEKLQEILQDIEGLEAEHADLQDNTIPYLKTQVGLIQPAMDSHMRECNDTHSKPKDVRACQKRVEQTYKAALKTETKNLKTAEKRFLQVEKDKKKLEKRYKSTTKKLHKMSVTQQAQFEGKCKLGAGAPKPKSTRKKAPTEKVGAEKA
jgi:chromosome segregation ATPase